MTRTHTHPMDYQRQPRMNEDEKAVSRLPYQWRMRYQEIYFARPHILTQHQAYLQVFFEMTYPDDCACCLPEQHCSVDAHLEAAYDDQSELPY